MRPRAELMAGAINEGSYSSIKLGARDFKMFRELIFEKSGINLRESKRDLLKTRLGGRIKSKGLRSFSEYYLYIQNDNSGRELAAMLDAISTNVTSFFREMTHFQSLEKEVIPAAVERKRKDVHKVIRGWSAGCSSGEEPYSMALTIAEHPALEGKRWEIKILATDISQEMLERGQAGRFGKDKIDALPKKLVKERFNRITPEEDGMYEIDDKIRKMVHFRRFNLMTPEYPFKNKFDFIFCRNVMIYFDRPTQEVLINKFYDFLDAGGSLMIGHSESLTGLNHKFKYVRPTIYIKPEAA